MIIKCAKLLPESGHLCFVAWWTNLMENSGRADTKMSHVKCSFVPEKLTKTYSDHFPNLRKITNNYTSVQQRMNGKVSKIF